MNDAQTAPLAEAISAQQNGIILAFSEYAAGSQNYGWHYFTVPKVHVERSNGSGTYFTLVRASTPVLARKYLYIFDAQINGHVGNGQAPNNVFVLREVRGY